MAVTSVESSLVCEFPKASEERFVKTRTMALYLEKVDLSKRVIVLIDADNTLFAPDGVEIGSAQWRAYIKEKGKKEGLSKEETEAALDRLWYYVQPRIQMRLVDQAAKKAIQELQPKVPVLVFTARDFDEVAHTEKQLQQVGIDFSNTHFPQEIDLPLPHKGLYKNGVIYCGENAKGDTMDAFFRATREFEEILNFDDKREQLESSQKKAKVPYTGVHVVTEDERVKAFNSAIADLQIELLVTQGKMVSNKQAEEMLVKEPRKSMTLEQLLKFVPKL